MDNAVTFNLFAFNSGTQTGTPQVQLELAYAPPGRSEPDIALPILVVGTNDTWTVSDNDGSNLRTITYNGDVSVGSVASLNATVAFFSVGSALKVLRAAVLPSAQGPIEIARWTTAVPSGP